NHSPGESCNLSGSYIIFPATQTEGDDRTSIADRYPGGQAQYSEMRAAAVGLLIQQRYVLEQDRASLSAGTLGEPSDGSHSCSSGTLGRPRGDQPTLWARGSFRSAEWASAHGSSADRATHRLRASHSRCPQAARPRQPRDAHRSSAHGWLEATYRQC